MSLNRIIVAFLLLLLSGKAERLYQLPNSLLLFEGHSEVRADYKNTPYFLDSFYCQTEDNPSSEIIDEFEEDPDDDNDDKLNRFTGFDSIALSSTSICQSIFRKPPITKKRLFILYSSLKLDC